MESIIEISVIIPVYNAEKYIDRCVSSLLGQQTQWEFELVLVDDGSQDNSLAHLKELERKNTRIRLFSQPNQGVSAARNRGVSEARGSYIVFVDSDDWVEDYYLEYLRNSLDTNEPGLVVGGFFRESRNNVTDGVENPLTFYSEDFHLMIRRMQMHRQSFPFGKIFKTSIIKEHHLRFEEGVHFGEDLIFVYNYLCHISYVKFIGCCGYHYITHKNSLAMSYGSYECELKGFNAYKTVTLRLQEQYQISKDELVYSNNNLANFLLRAVKVMYRPGKNHLPLSDRLHHLREDIASDDIELLEAYSEHCDGINKIVCQCILHQKIIKLDVILSSFFFCRYSAPARILIRIIRYLKK